MIRYIEISVALPYGAEAVCENCRIDLGQIGQIVCNEALSNLYKCQLSRVPLAKSEYV